MVRHLRTFSTILLERRRYEALIRRLERINTEDAGTGASAIAPRGAGRVFADGAKRDRDGHVGSNRRG